MRILFLILLFFLSTSIKAQNFEGTWEGIYITSDSSFWDSIKIDFEWKKDNSYSIKSYTKGKNNSGKDTIIVCRMEYKIISVDSLILTEAEILAPPGITPGICFQSIELKYHVGHHRSRYLLGKWYCTPDRTKGNGFIRLGRIYRD